MTKRSLENYLRIKLSNTVLSSRESILTIGIFVDGVLVFRLVLFIPLPALVLRADDASHYFSSFYAPSCLPCFLFVCLRMKK